MLRKKYFFITLGVIALGVVGYFLFFPSGKYKFENQEIILDDCGDGDEDCAEVSINYMLCKKPSAFAQAFNDTIQRQLVRILTAKDTVMGVKEAGELFLTQYKSDKQQFEGMTPYQIQIVDTILLENDALISLQRSGTEYLGGAHSVSWATFMNFKASDGTFFPQEELFTDMGKILEVAEKHFRETFNISDGENLSENGFMFQNDIFSLPKNIGFDQNYLILLYNPYEIAPYSTGILEVKIPLSEVNPWLSFNLNDPKRK